MSEDLAAYLLLAIDLLVVAVLLALPMLLLAHVAGRLAAVRAAPRERRGAARETDQPGAEEPAADAGERALRRCDDCGVLWKDRPGTDASAATLMVRRWVRRRTRARRTDTPAWAKRRGWSRCPSCLSTNVRTSRAQHIRR